jgi:toxin YoeB
MGQKMKFIFSPKAISDLEFWKKTENVAIESKIDALFDSINKNPYQGIGKPEQLKHKLSGLWSRRINQEHRLIYDVREGIIEILSLKGHYK